jgi:hypothetical protein
MTKFVRVLLLGSVLPAGLENVVLVQVRETAGAGLRAVVPLPDAARILAGSKVDRALAVMAVVRVAQANEVAVPMGDADLRDLVGLLIPSDSSNMRWNSTRIRTVN